MRMVGLCIFWCCFLGQLAAQSLGGNAVFNFATQANTAQLSALGGINVSNMSNDVGLAFQNPALLRPSMHQQMNSSFNLFFAGIKNYSLTTAWHAAKPNTTFAFGVNYFNYGNIPQTDAAGNVLGNFMPRDYVLQLSACKQHNDFFYFGTTIKFLSSNYSTYKSNAIAADIALAYLDTAHFLQASVVIKNLGTQLKTYTSTNNKEELPFDVQAGITKKLAKAPLQFSLTAHHLHTSNIYYNDTSFRRQEGEEDYSNQSFTEQIFSHLIFAAQLKLQEKLEISFGYNFLRRQSLNVYNTANGLNGTSLGLGMLLKKLHIRYATSFYQQNLYHHMALNISFGNRL